MSKALTKEEVEKLKAFRNMLEALARASTQVGHGLEVYQVCYPEMETILKRVESEDINLKAFARSEILFLTSTPMRQICTELINRIGHIMNKLEERKLYAKRK